MNGSPSLMWPTYETPEDIDAIEAVPLSSRGLPTSTFDAVERAAAQWPGSTAYIALPDGSRWSEGHEVTYDDLACDVRRIANALHALGIGRADAVGLLSTNTADLIPAILGAQTAGIAAPVNPALRHDHITHLLRTGAAKVLIAAGPELDPAVWQVARAVAAELGLSALLALRPVDADPDREVPLEPVDGVRVAYLREIAGGLPGDRLVGVEPPGPQSIAAFFHTGGTTGLPKLAAHTHSMEIVDAWAVAAPSDLPEDGTLLAALPLFHVNALVVTLLAPLLRGRRVLWAGPLGYRDPGLLMSFWQIVQAYGIAGMSAVPLVYSVLTQVPVNADISSLRMCIVGAAPLPPAVVDGFEQHTGLRLCEGYGLTEATCASSRSFVDHPRPGHAGQRLPYQQIKAVRVDEATGQWSDLPAGQVGTLVISGPVLFPGYVTGHTPEGPVLDTMGKVRDGWLDTGDLGSVDAQGFVRLAGRAKDLIIRGGHNIDPASIEDALRAHPAVVDAGAVGQPDPRAGEVPVAFVTVRDPSVSTKELREWAAAHVPEPAAAPKSVSILEAIPVTAVGKPYKPALRVLATRAFLVARLDQWGLPVPDDDAWCREEGGRIHISLAAAADPRVRELLDAVDLDWEVTNGG